MIKVFLPKTTASSDQEEEVKENVGSSTDHHGEGSEYRVFSQSVEAALERLQGGEGYRLLVVLHQQGILSDEVNQSPSAVLCISVTLMSGIQCVQQCPRSGDNFINSVFPYFTQVIFHICSCQVWALIKPECQSFDGTELIVTEEMSNFVK